MENNKNKKSVKFQGDMLNFCDFIQVFVFTRNHQLNEEKRHVVNACFLGPPCKAICLVLTQKYNSVLKDLREQTRWVCLFHCKDRDSFEDCLRKNDVIPSREQRALVRQQLAETKHAKLLL